MTATYAKTELTDAVEVLMRGYQEELSLYTTVRTLTAQQHALLRQGRKMQRVCDLLEEKEDVLRLIGQIESELRKARKVVVSNHAEGCPNRERLAEVLDNLAQTIEETRILEMENAALLQGAAG